MSKYNLSCTIQNIQHIAIFGFFFRGQNKNKNAAQNITGKASTVNDSANRQQQCKVLK